MYRSSRRRREREKQKREAQELAATLLLLAVLVAGGFFFRNSILPALSRDKQPSKTVVAQPPSTNPADPPAGYIRLHPGCEIQRERIAQRISRILNITGQTLPGMPPYIGEKAGTLLADVDAGIVCAYSEQELHTILPGMMMQVHVEPPTKLYFILTTLDEDEEDFGCQASYAMAHEQLHRELNFGSGRESFIQEEMEVRRRICDNAVRPELWRDGNLAPSYGLKKECRQYWENPAKFEAEVRKRYTRNYDMQQ